ncbi:hypothetical protein BS47DRAFT_650292 [Hydnum rufescens UP504]|uniref:Nitrogen permease regulator 3 n=1 Tax=Hydnum rufescens UP504 TaxID=1448309 RepID=A0A9P6E0J1_9AGAM|nr:hypothetical protein BS47DRAFT_650292 [Hydnum rufescens UP504]
MATADLIAVFLVTDSSKGANLVFRWPPKPHVPIRLARPRPPAYLQNYMLTDAAYRASLTYDAEQLKKVVEAHPSEEDTPEAPAMKYRWQPHWHGTGDLDSLDFPCTTYEAPVQLGRNSPPPPSDEESKETDKNTQKSALELYEDLIGYQAAFLAELLSPRPALCHQKFELSIDELAFVGHPVHAKEDGSWGFSELYDRPAAMDTENDLRGRTQDRPPPRARFHFADDGEDGDTEDHPTGPPVNIARALPRALYPKPGSPISFTSPSTRRANISRTPAPSPTSLLKSFHLVIVLDRPDPSSVASTDLDRYIDAYYRQFAFKFTAAMLYEQWRVGFVAQESDTLVRLRESTLTADSSSPESEKQFEAFFEAALAQSSLASAIRAAYEAVVTSSIAQVMINTIPVNVQLPPGHLNLLKVDQQPEIAEDILTRHDSWGWDHGDDDDDADARLEDELRFGWKMPPLRPWKSVLILDQANPADIVHPPRKPDTPGRSMDPTEALARFLSIASPTISLFESADLLDLDLETELYPLVRLLVYNRKAKVVDVVRANLTNIYAPTAVFTRPISELSVLFSQEFPTLSPLPSLLSVISSSHRPFNSLVPSRDHRSIFLRALLWMLSHDILVILHVRIRIVVSREIKSAALKAKRAEAEAGAANRSRRAVRRNGMDLPNSPAGGKALELEPEHVQWADIVKPTPSTSQSKSRSEGSTGPRQRLRPDSVTSLARPTAMDEIAETNGQGHTGSNGGAYDEDEDEDEDEEEEVNERRARLRRTVDSTEVETSELEEETDEDLTPSFLIDPERATRPQRRWLDAMCVGKDEYLVRWFRKVSPFFDGKRTTDEILHRTEITRRQLREVLQHFDEYLMLLLHA